MTASERWMFILNHTLAKVLSARFWTVICVIGTLCMIIYRVGNMIAAVVETGKDIPPIAKEIVMMFVGAFITLVSSITTLYFTRDDRSRPESWGGRDEHSGGGGGGNGAGGGQGQGGQQ